MINISRLLFIKYQTNYNIVFESEYLDLIKHTQYKDCCCYILKKILISDL